MGLLKTLARGAQNLSDFEHRLFGMPTDREQTDMRYQVQDQMKAYKDQMEITKQEIERKRGEEKAEKRRIEEKQIRALRGRLRTPGIMGGQAVGSGATPAAGTTNKLGA